MANEYMSDIMETWVALLLKKMDQNLTFGQILQQKTAFLGIFS